MDLSPLREEFVCVTNMGLRAVGDILPRADMHFVLDTHRYRRFAAEIEDLGARHAVRYRFLNIRMRGRWRRYGRGERPYFLTNNPEKLSPGEALPHLSNGVVTGSSVLLSAAVLLDHLGFSEICVIGCDLEYAPGATYFYETGELDLVHESDPVVIGKRNNMVLVNAQFSILRDALQRSGTRLVNAGLDGQLESLPRVSFEDMFRTSGR